MAAGMVDSSSGPDPIAPTPAPGAPPPPFPSTADVAEIGNDTGPVLRNLRITEAYFELSSAVAALTDRSANWCTFATWASKQAGQTIRGEDLRRAIEADLGVPGALDRALSGDGSPWLTLHQILSRIGHTVDRSRLLHAILEVASPFRAVDRASAAVARGNKKVFDEIGLQFSRFLECLGAGASAAAVARFNDGLHPGPPPEGQDLLVRAFGNYREALATRDAKNRAELLLLANLRIGFHEQTRLQPEIAEALDAPIADPSAVAARLHEEIFPRADPLTRAFDLAARGLGLAGVLDRLSHLIVERLRRLVRQVVTEHLMTLGLPGEGPIHLGRDLTGQYPALLRQPVSPDLIEILREADPMPDSTAGSGARDWADLSQRMHFITELFRTHQETPALFGPPFSPGQTQAIHELRIPPGPL
jgi:hypothetical protein